MWAHASVLFVDQISSPLGLVCCVHHLARAGQACAQYINRQPKEISELTAGVDNKCISSCVQGRRPAAECVARRRTRPRGEFVLFLGGPTAQTKFRNLPRNVLQGGAGLYRIRAGVNL